jgi:hypothetical protein
LQYRAFRALLNRGFSRTRPARPIRKMGIWTRTSTKLDFTFQFEFTAKDLNAAFRDLSIWEYAMRPDVVPVKAKK